MQKSDGRILTTHAGSLPRPKALTSLHARRFAGETIDQSALDAATLEATREIVAKQIEAGLDVINNGELGRESFFTYVQHRMTGFGGASTRPYMADMVRYPSYVEYLMRTALGEESVNLMTAPKAVGDIAYKDTAAIAAECAELNEALASCKGRYVEAFVSSPSPGIVAAAMTNDHYPTMEAYVDALAAALATEYRAIVDAGFLLQIDAPDLAMERHTLFADKPLSDFLDFIRVVIAAINKAVAEIPRDKVRLHVCWGNYEGPHDLDVPLQDILPEIQKAHAGAWLISMANPRHAHEHRCFKGGALPDDTLLVAGVIDTTTNYVEHPEVVADRIELAAEAVGDPARVLAGTDCGFETSAGMQSVVDEVAWVKFRALSEGAKIASQRLFGAAAA